jgi:hypothetical protein
LSEESCIEQGEKERERERGRYEREAGLGEVHPQKPAGKRAVIAAPARPSLQ